MSGPRTAKDALLAELLGDMDQLLTRFDQSQKSMEELRASIQRSHEAKAGQAARELEAATVKFGEVTTRSVDDFVSVANEALSKFMQRTNEIKGLLDNLAADGEQGFGIGQVFVFLLQFFQLVFGKCQIFELFKLVAEQLVARLLLLA